VNFITTIINLRARGLTWMRMPFFVWAMLVTGFLLLLAFPPLEAAGIMQLMDRVTHSSFFMPSGLFTKSEGLADLSGGGSPLLFQHLFWFLGHPEVYVLLLPAFACVGEILPVHTRKPLWGYKAMVYAVLVLGFLSFIVWAHHMYMTGMGAAVSTFFQTTTVLISVPSVIIITALLISLWGGSIRFTPPMLWACAFIPMFGIGGLTGLPLAFNLADLHLHDTYYVIGHFHYVVAPGILFGLFAGVLHWYPKITGRYMSSKLNHLHFWPSLICMNIIFFPMLLQGMAGFHRRWYNGGDAYLSKAADSVNVFGNTVAAHIDMNIVMSMGAWTMALAQIPFIINLFTAWKFGKKVESDNPWEATTLEWATPTPPGHGNFTFVPAVYRGPYEYSRPDRDEDFYPQWVEPDQSKTSSH
jgi:cytochrome c oxidase subunit 1